MSELDRSLNALYLYFEQQRFYLEVIDLYEDALRQLWEESAGQADGQDAAVAVLAGRLQLYWGLWNSRVGRVQQSQAAYEAAWSLLQGAGDPAAAAFCRGAWGASLRGSDPKRAAAMLVECRRLLEGAGATWMHTLGQEMLGEICLLLGDYTAAGARMTTALSLATQIEWIRGMASTRKSLGLLNLFLGDYQAAETHLAASLSLARPHHFTLLCVEGILLLGRVYRLQRPGQNHSRRLSCGERAVWPSSVESMRPPQRCCGKAWRSGCRCGGRMPCRPWAGR